MWWSASGSCTAGAPFSCVHIAGESCDASTEGGSGAVTEDDNTAAVCGSDRRRIAIDLDSLRSPRTIAIAAASVAGGAIILVGGWFLYSAYQTRGSGAYAEALTRAQGTQSPRAPAHARAAAIRELEAVLAEYPTNATAVQAAYELGNLRYLNREYPAARGAFEVALAKGAKGTLRSLSRAGIAYTWESERNFPKAVQAFQSALEGLKPQDFLYEELMFGLARNQELSGQKDAAIATYRRLLQELPKARRSDLARTRLAELGAAPQS